MCEQMIPTGSLCINIISGSDFGARIVEECPFLGNDDDLQPYCKKLDEPIKNYYKICDFNK